MNRIKIVSRLAALLPVVAMLLLPLPGHGQQAVRFERAELSIETTSGEVFEFKIELAESGAQKARGLMFRREMAADAGMLFLHRRDKVLTMWMANTFLPLDMLFIAANGRIVTIEENTIPQSREIISSREKVRAVLELNAGTARDLSIVVGDRVIYEAFGQ